MNVIENGIKCRYGINHIINKNTQVLESKKWNEVRDIYLNDMHKTR